MDTSLLLIALAIGVICYFLGRLMTILAFRKREQFIRTDAAKRSRAVIGGQFSEQLAPYLPEFPYRPTEVKFLGKPTDFIVFEGLDEKNISRVVFVEVKSNSSKLSSTEQSLAQAIKDGHVSFETYHIPQELTK